jgi:thymidylate synthase (FAD)
MVLPNACTTCIEVKMNLRALMNFMNERLCSCAQWEIRELALAMKRVIVEKYPELEPYLVPKCEKYGKEFGFCNESKSRSCGRHPTLKEIFNRGITNG